MMNPERIDSRELFQSGSEQNLDKIVKRIEQGALFVYPTETIYGIGGSVQVKGVAEAIYEAKRRPENNPLILLAGNRDHFRSLDIWFPPRAERLADHFWPGMLTLVLPSNSSPEGIAVRVSNHPFILRLYEKLDVPIYSTSANISGQAYKNDPDYIYSVFKDHIEFMIDEGVLPPSAPSTVVKVNEQDEVSIIREGTISKEKIHKCMLRCDSA